MIRRRAIRVEQSDSQPVFLFALRMDELLAVADVSRVAPVSLETLVRYKRADVRKAVDKLAESLNAEGLPFPLPITVALSSQVRFKRSRGPRVDDGIGVAGTLDIPLDDEPTKKAVWIVGGQLAMLALSHAKRSKLPLAISGFVCDDVAKLREQFERINSVPRLPATMAGELLPTLLGSFPPRLPAKEVPVAICDWLNESTESPFHCLIKSASGTQRKQKALVPVTAVTKMIAESLSTPSGCLFPYRNIATGETDFEGICRVLLCFWTAVEIVFPDAWGKPPSKSRLMHGAGIRTMGRLMDRVMPSMRLEHRNVQEEVTTEIEKVAPVCRWTSGTWDELGLKWNEIQSVPRHINMLSNFLIRTYFQAD
jgi:DGQHR domain-containing protein